MSTTSSDASLSDSLVGDTVTVERYRRARGAEAVCRLLAGWVVVGPPAAAVHRNDVGRYTPPVAACGRNDPHGAHYQGDTRGGYPCEGLA